MKRAFLALEDGTVYWGRLFGAEREAFGEVVFNTSMTGYQEILTDPSYAGQIVTLTYPLIGNYGINEADFESKRIQAAGLVVREECRAPSHMLSRRTLHEFLQEYEIPGLSEVDTRALVRRLRNFGVMMGCICFERSPKEALEELERFPRYDTMDFAQKVSSKIPALWLPDRERPLEAEDLELLSFEISKAKEEGRARLHVAVLDCGLKHNIPRSLNRLGCAVSILPCTASFEEIRSLSPDGVLLSPGPGDPALLGYLLEKIRLVLEHFPAMGICLGHQLIARAFGAQTFKLKFGHRGGNHPVKDLESGRVYITAQNHGYAVDPQTLPPDLVVTHINLNDGTVEGLRHRKLPIFSIQYHSEASPGPLDNMYLFEKFVKLMEGRGAQDI